MGVLYDGMKADETTGNREYLYMGYWLTLRGCVLCAVCIIYTHDK